MERYVGLQSAIEGGVAEVVRCEDTNLNRRVIIKFVGSGDHRRLLDELSALQLIRSKHVVQLFDVVYRSNGTQMGIVEEFVDGSELTGLLGSVSDEAFVRLAYQVAAGLSDIHSHDVIHRDIKPSNLMIDSSGILKIIDFNLSRRTRNCETRGFVGTRGYAAPELYADDTDNVSFDQSVDVFAMGVTAVALLGGPSLPSEFRRRPPDPESWLASSPELVDRLRRVDSGLAQLLLSCLSSEASRRPTAASVRDRALELLLRDRHRALLTDEAGNRHTLDAARPRVRITHGPDREIQIAYNSFRFMVEESRDAWINNRPAETGAPVPQSCVIGLGSPSLQPRERLFVTMDSSHPEVVL